ncbi:MAG: FAD-dependent oxidoreductase [Porticoccus sp.]|uniref:FAD-dependent oxidoreductase n=1 Tax=Porticoccus sp. TaxID=2024853 RepID=UPI00329A3720
MADNNPSEPHPGNHFDVVVIGGGIMGAGVVQAAQAAGYNCLVLEKNSWGSGTSSKSSKLIHGGLRYLQSWEFSLVRESLRERTRLLSLAPQLVYGNWFYIPLYEGSRLRSWQLRTGLTLYWLLSGCRTDARFNVVPPTEWSKLAGLKTTGLKKVYRYRDAQTDDAKLTSAVIQSAASLGAEVGSPAEVIAAESTPEGYRVLIKTASRESAVHCRFLVNAAGPWANQMARRITPEPGHLDVDLVQGTHLLLDRKISDRCFYLESPSDGRAVFVLPWYNTTLLGTTETGFDGDPDQVLPTAAERDYLLGILKHYFPDYDGQVCDEMAGLRVLPKATEGFHHRSREVEFVENSHYLAIYGGKLTGYRATAEKVLERIEKKLGPASAGRRGDTRQLPLPPAEKQS